MEEAISKESRWAEKLNFIMTEFNGKKSESQGNNRKTNGLLLILCLLTEFFWMT
jgi:hypothetical protein